MNVLIYVIIVSIVIIALIQFGLPVLFRAKKKLEETKTISKVSSIWTITLSLTLPILIGLAFGFMSASVAACLGWLNYGFGFGLFSGIALCIALLYQLPTLYKIRSSKALLGAMGVSLLIAISSFFFYPALSNFNEVDSFHHPIYLAVDNGFVNSVISYLGDIFPMQDYPISSTDTEIYSPERSFLESFTTASNFSYAVVGIVSVVAIFGGKAEEKRRKFLFNEVPDWEINIKKEAAVLAVSFIFI